MIKFSDVISGRFRRIRATPPRKELDETVPNYIGVVDLRVESWRADDSDYPSLLSPHDR
jgi:hypothetical protein